MKYDSRIKPMEGLRFGKLTVIRLYEYRSKTQKSRFWRCKCDCGRIVNVIGSHLRIGKTTSCGCFKVHYIHGGKGTRLYRIYNGMKDRCYNNNSKDKKNYLLKGIRICDEWKKSFSCFREWSTNNGYREGLTIDRINSNGNYEPDNCRWVTLSENVKNVDRKGENQSRHKITEEQAYEIINTPVYRGANIFFSKKFNIGVANVQQIRHGASWKHLKRPIMDYDYYKKHNILTFYYLDKRHKKEN
jgi:hypothetical protein